VTLTRAPLGHLRRPSGRPVVVAFPVTCRTINQTVASRPLYESVAAGLTIETRTLYVNQNTPAGLRRGKAGRGHHEQSRAVPGLCVIDRGGAAGGERTGSRPLAYRDAVGSAAFGPELLRAPDFLLGPERGTKKWGQVGFSFFFYSCHGLNDEISRDGNVDASDINSCCVVPCLPRARRSTNRKGQEQKEVPP
jgi:hypothetical protein